MIGGILIDGRVMVQAEAILDADDFYRENHKTIFKAMLSLTQRQEPVDLVTLQKALGGKEKLELVGGMSYLADLIAFVPSANQVKHYARIVREASIVRAMGIAASEIVAEHYEVNENLEQFLNDAEAKIAGIARRQRGAPEKPMGERLNAVLAGIGNRERRGMTTGFSNLDAYLQGGFFRGDMFVLAAKTSVGKTACALNFATHVSRGGTLFLSVEMRDDQLMRRALADLANVNFREIELRDEGIEESEVERLAFQSTQLESMNLEIVKRRRLTPRDVRREAILASHKWDGKLDLVIVDYLQLMQSDEPLASRNLEVAQISGALKDLAEELDCCVMALSQLNRAGAKRENPKPTLDDLRDSGSIEQDADVVVFLWKPPEKKGEYVSEHFEKVYATIAKQRSGPLGTVEMEFDKAHTRFREKSF